VKRTTRIRIMAGILVLLCVLPVHLAIGGTGNGSQSTTVTVTAVPGIIYTRPPSRPPRPIISADGVTQPVTPVAATFAASDLFIAPTEVDIGETVYITILITNTGGQSGSYTILLKINGVKEAEDSVTLAPGRSQDVAFTVTKEDAGSYSVVVDGLSGSFTVVALPPPPAPPPPAPPVAPPPPPGVNWAIVGPIIAVAVFLAIFLPLRQRRKRLG